MPDHKLSPDHSVDLYKFFQSRVDTIKASMFESVTWVVGFAAAVLGFVVVTFVDFSKAKVTVGHPAIGSVFCGVGVVLCIYALFLLYDSAVHIRGTWDRSEICAKEFQGLTGLTPNSRARGGRFKVWHRMGLVVIGFLIAHLALIVTLWVGP